MGLWVNGQWREDLADTPQTRASVEAAGGKVTQDKPAAAVTSGGGGGGVDMGALQSAIANANRPFFEETSGFSIKDLEERARQFNEQLAMRREELEKLGIPRLEIERQLAELRATEVANQDRQFNARLGFDYATQALNVASDPFALSDFMRNAQAVGGVPGFIRDLQRGVGPELAGPGGNAPLPMTLQGIVQAMGGMGAGGAAGPGSAVAPAGGLPAGATVLSEQVINGAPVRKLSDQSIQKWDGTSWVHAAVDNGGSAITGNVLRMLQNTVQAPRAAQMAAQPAATPAAGGYSIPNRGDVPASNAPISNMVMDSPTRGNQPIGTVPTRAPVGQQGYDVGATLGALKDVFTKGAGALAPGTLERLSDLELRTTTQGFNRAFGEDASPAFLDQYRRTRPQQQAARGTSLAYV